MNSPQGALSPHPSGRVVLALSGGVDSSVAALLLRQAGCDLQALFMKNWEEDDAQGYCAAAEDRADAQAVCAELRIPLRTANYATEYWSEVFEEFLAELRCGRTPNPDVLCNRAIKFGVFLEHARDLLGADYIATGHYARVERREGRYRLCKAVDTDKDQSYFLYLLNQHQLARTVFPLGNLTKQRVRELARDAGLPTHDKRGSTGLCFIGERPFGGFITRFIDDNPGNIETDAGEVIGRHTGLAHYTLGQRRGLGIGGRIGASEEAWYTVAKDVERNVLVAAQGRTHPLLYSREVEASSAHWIAGEPPAPGTRLGAKTRYRQTDQGCKVLGITEDRFRVRFDEPQWAVTPGQSVVLYRGNECLGGGVIERRE